MPLARHDICNRISAAPLCRFLLTCLLRGMTVSCRPCRLHWVFLLTCLLRGMTNDNGNIIWNKDVSTHMPLARHDDLVGQFPAMVSVSTHMPLARHDSDDVETNISKIVSTHMPLARHDMEKIYQLDIELSFYSHASCEA